MDKKSASKPKQKLPAIAGNIPPSVPSTIPLGEVNINSKLSLDIPFINTKANKNTITDTHKNMDRYAQILTNFSTNLLFLPLSSL